MDKIYHLFVCLKKYHNSELVLDPSDQGIDQYDFEHQDWTSRKFVHVSGKENLPINMTPPHGLGFLITSRVYAYHAGDTVTKNSRTVL